MLKKIKFNVFLMLFLVSLSASFFPCDIKNKLNQNKTETFLNKKENKFIMKNGSIAENQKNFASKFAYRELTWIDVSFGYASFLAMKILISYVHSNVSGISFASKLMEEFFL